MIKLIKGLLVPNEGLSFCLEFREHRLKFTNLDKYNYPPYEAMILSRENVLELCNWLEERLKDKRCESCYDFKIPKNFSGTLNCNKCQSPIENE